ncbi:uncharacterized protein LOC133785807 [Humulus lupulus]|uniref:uncharacterized protein LOC133785807 n=1 Tax=Humulus lupulus TaxID=3486 RepID=UPI002B405AE8|nr:uncharacterized protein LOC133785807 [Humulus lupulus]
MCRKSFILLCVFSVDVYLCLYCVSFHAICSLFKYFKFFFFPSPQAVSSLPSPLPIPNANRLYALRHRNRLPTPSLESSAPPSPDHPALTYPNPILPETHLPLPQNIDPPCEPSPPPPTLDPPTHEPSPPPKISAIPSPPREPSPPPCPPSPPPRAPSLPPNPTGIASRTRTRHSLPAIPSAQPKSPGRVKTLARKRKPSPIVVPESTPDSPHPSRPAKKPKFVPPPAPKALSSFWFFKGKASASSSSKGTIFLNYTYKKWFIETISLRKLLPERLLDSTEFTSLGLYDIIEFHGWKEFVSTLRVPCPSLVHEFYSNLSADVIDPIHENFGKVFLRGNWIPFTPSVIAECLHLPLLDAPTFSAEFNPDMDVVACTLTGNPSSTWPTSNAVLIAELTPLYRILHVVAIFNWQPTAHKSTVGADLARFLFAVGTCQSISLPRCLFQVILEVAMWPGVSRMLPLPCLIQRMDHCFSAVPSKSLDTRLSLKAINLASTRSKAKKKGLSVKDPMAASSLGVKPSS